MNSAAAFASVGVFIGCCANAVFLELLVKQDPGCGHLVTFSQFLFIALEGIIFESKFFTAKRNVPLKKYAVVVLIFFLANALNNYAFHFKVSMPLHMIFRSGSLITNMAMSIIMLKRSYAWLKYLAVFIITIGISICTIVSAQDFAGENASKNLTETSNPLSESEDFKFFWWCIGILILLGTLFISAMLGIYQEMLYSTHGKHPSEVMFYTHLLTMPIFLTLSGSIKEHGLMAINSPLLSIPLLGVQLPSTICYLIGNVLSQYICISSVYTLSSVSQTLTVNLVITLRKFVSLLMSIIYFQNAFTVWHWTGSILVFIGTFLFLDMHSTLVKFLCRTERHSKSE